MHRAKVSRTAQAGVIAGLLTVVGAGSGCSEFGTEFRAAAGDTIKAGVNTLLDGFVEGVFAVVEPGNPTEAE
ncbi:MAG: hypothetical protein BroJett003_13830 [Planctomycetota bacterium]|nr:MAG: hypothetical protein BroJett003_13830 [Planctomycetota bacterium]